MSTPSQPSLNANPPRGARFQPSFFATKPTATTKFMRTFLPWQMLRFVWINLRMIIIIRRSHH